MITYYLFRETVVIMYTTCLYIRNSIGRSQGFFYGFSLGSQNKKQKTEKWEEKGFQILSQISEKAIYFQYSRSFFLKKTRILSFTDTYVLTVLIKQVA